MRKELKRLKIVENSDSVWRYKEHSTYYVQPFRNRIGRYNNIHGEQWVWTLVVKEWISKKWKGSISKDICKGQYAKRYHIQYYIQKTDTCCLRCSHTNTCTFFLCHSFYVLLSFPCVSWTQPSLCFSLRFPFFPLHFIFSFILPWIFSQKKPFLS